MNRKPSDKPSFFFFRWLKGLMAWTESFASKPYGLWALLILAFAESSFFPIPPDVLLIALAVSLPKKAFKYALFCAIGSVIGGIAGYGIGYYFWEAAQGWFYAYVPGFTPDVFNVVKQKYQENAFFAVFTAAFTPIPYKVFTIAGGVCDIGLKTLIIASGIGRTARFFLVAALFYFIGPSVKAFIDKYFEWLTILFAVLLIGGFIAIKYLFH
jgi:membrane protein YqaA with SNARE-associated domain